MTVADSDPPRELSPYRGLAAFGDTDLDAQLFFGRERESEIVAANLQASRLTVLYGASGVGKSSLLRAGVAHRLRSGDGNAGRHVVAVCANWRGDPVAAIASAVSVELSHVPGLQIPPVRRASLADELEAWCDALDGEIYVMLDQLEEYVLYHGAEGGGPLADLLAEVVTRPNLRVGVLLGIRDDALSQLDALKARVPALFGNLLRLDHLTREEGRDAIVGPLAELARLGAGEVVAEPALVDAVLDQVAAGKITAGEGRGIVAHEAPNGRIEAPYLQLVMERLWEVEREQGSRTLRAATLAELGGAAMIVEEHLAHALAALDASGRDLAAAAFGFLVTPSGTKIAHRAADLAGYAGVSESDLTPVLDRLAHERVLRPVADERGGPRRYEIFHDVLADAVLAWRIRHDGERELERERADARRRHRRLAALAGIAGAGVAVMTALTVFAFGQRSEATAQARTAEARELEARALNLLLTDPELAVVLATRSARMSPSPTAEDVLRQTLLASHLLRVIPVGAPLTDIGFEQGKIWAATADGHARLYVARHVGGRYRPELDVRHTAPVAQVLPQAFGLVSAGLDRAARIAVEPDLTSLARPAMLRHAQPVTALAESSCRVDELCLVTGAGQLISGWDYATGRRLRAVRVRALVRELAPLRPGLVAVRASDTTVRVVDMRTGRVVRRFEANERVDSIAGRADGLVAAGLADGSVRTWNALSGKPAARFVGHVGPVLDVDLAGRLLLSGSADGTAIVWDFASGRAVPLPGGHGNVVRAVELSQDGRFAVTGSADRTAKVWETEGGRLVSLLAGHRDAVVDVAFSADGARVVTGSLDGTVRLWDAATRVDLRRSAVAAPAPPAREATALDGTRAVVSGRTVRLQSPGGETLQLQGHRDDVNSVAFGPDGTRLVTASRDHDARIWDTRTGALVHLLEGHFGSVADARFSPDGRWVVTAGPITAGLWNVRSGELVTYLRGPRTGLTAAAFGDDSRMIVTVEDDGTVRRFRCSLCGEMSELVGIADSRLRATGRTLTADERQRYLR